MRTEPIIKKESEANQQLFTQIIKYVAIIVAFISVFAFYVKMLFL
jgi:hypothetical protein